MESDRGEGGEEEEGQEGTDETQIGFKLNEVAYN